MSKAMGIKEYDFLENEGAYFRRDRSHGLKGVDDVLANGKWVPYKGDAYERGCFGNLCEDPLAGQGAKVQEPKMAKGMALFFKPPA